MDSTELTSRQLEMLALCARGLSREEIGRELFVSPHTVKVTLDEARRRLDVGNVTHAVSKCVVLGLLCVSQSQICVTSQVVSDYVAAA